MTLAQLADALGAAPCEIRDSDDGSAHRSAIMAGIMRDGAFVAANYLRSALGQPGGGHISPLGAYDHLTDSALVMDTNPSYGWGWVDLGDLIEAMRTPDGSGFRGYVVASG